MFHLYHIIRQCPRCGSYKTGRCIKEDFLNESIVKLALFLGEYVINVPVSLYEHNCFCSECGLMWNDDIELSLLTQKEFEEQLELRGIREARKSAKNYYNSLREKKQDYDKAKKRENGVKNRLKKIIKFYSGF